VISGSAWDVADCSRSRYQLQVKVKATDKLPRLPSEYFLDNFLITTAGVTSMPALRLSLDVLGSERILFAADYPYEDDAAAVRFLDIAKVTEEERKQIYETNAVRVFKLKA
jgi:2,3-dihydroxybenzoate decarboxylase